MGRLAGEPVGANCASARRSRQRGSRAAYGPPALSMPTRLPGEACTSPSSFSDGLCLSERAWWGRVLRYHLDHIAAVLSALVARRAVPSSKELQ